MFDFLNNTMEVVFWICVAFLMVTLIPMCLLLLVAFVAIIL